MKILSILIVGLVALVFIALIITARLSHNGQAPGLIEGKLSACPETPNCVCSEYQADSRHAIEPIEIPAQGPEAAQSRIRDIILELGGSIASERRHYMAATFSSELFGFVDDLEVVIDADGGLIQLRSASRVGYGDGDVNRKRVEKIRQRFAQTQPAN